jgi:gliding motility-associated-like protein
VANSTISWYAASTGGTPLATGPDFTTPALTTSTIYYASATLNGCEGPRLPVSAIINSTPTAPTGSDVSRCGDGTVQLSASGVANSTISWYAASTGGTPLATGPDFTTPALTASTIYYASATLNGCEGPRLSVSAIINPTPAAPTGSDVFRCGPGSLTLQASGQGGSTYNWYSSVSSTNPIGTGTEFQIQNLNVTTDYYVSAKISNNCESPRKLLKAVVNPIPDVNVTSEKSIINLGESVNLNATGGGTYFWTPAGSLNNSTAQNPIAKPQITTTYIVEVTLNGCKGKDSVKVEVVSESLTSDEIPNVFTPNNDGIGDTWKIPGALINVSNTLKVFNRWGSVVYEVNGYKNDWDGGEVPDGTYYYVFDDGKTKKTGSVTIIH